MNTCSQFDPYLFGHGATNTAFIHALLAAAVEGCGLVGELAEGRRGRLKAVGLVRLRPIEREGPSACIHLFELCTNYAPAACARREHTCFWPHTC